MSNFICKIQQEEERTAIDFAALQLNPTLKVGDLSYFCCLTLFLNVSIVQLPKVPIFFIGAQVCSIFIISCTQPTYFQVQRQKRIKNIEKDQRLLALLRGVSIGMGPPLRHIDLVDAVAHIIVDY